MPCQSKTSVRPLFHLAEVEMSSGNGRCCRGSCLWRKKPADRQHCLCGYRYLTSEGVDRPDMRQRVKLHCAAKLQPYMVRMRIKRLASTQRVLRGAEIADGGAGTQWGLRAPPSARDGRMRAIKKRSALGWSCPVTRFQINVGQLRVGKVGLAATAWLSFGGND